MKWQFTTPRAPHQIGCTEAVMKGAKTGHKKAIGEQILIPFKSYTLLLKVASIMNQRPSGRIPNNPDGGSYVFQRHASQTSLINRATWTVQRNKEPPT